MFSLAGNYKKMDRLVKLAECLYGMTANEIQALGSVLQAEKNTRKNGWSFFQKVYIRFAGSSDRNFISNFVVGRVVYADKEYVRVIGASGKMFITAMNDKESTTLYTVDRFNQLRDKMLNEKKFVDPKVAYIPQSAENGIVSNLDDVASKDVALRKPLSKSRSSSDDLVSIVSRMSRGLLGKERKTTKKTTELTFKG